MTSPVDLAVAARRHHRQVDGARCRCGVYNGSADEWERHRAAASLAAVVDWLRKQPAGDPAAAALRDAIRYDLRTPPPRLR